MSGDGMVSGSDRMDDRDRVGVIQDMFAAFGRGDVAAVLETIAPDVDWHLFGASHVPYPRRRKGRDQVADFFRPPGETAEFQAFEPREFSAQGDKVVVIGSERFRVRATGKVVENERAMVFTLRDGVIHAFRCHEDSAAVAEAHRQP